MGTGLHSYLARRLPPKVPIYLSSLFVRLVCICRRYRTSSGDWRLNPTPATPKQEGPGSSSTRYLFFSVSGYRSVSFLFPVFRVESFHRGTTYNPFATNITRGQLPCLYGFCMGVSLGGVWSVGLCVEGNSTEMTERADGCRDVVVWVGFPFRSPNLWSLSATKETLVATGVGWLSWTETWRGGVCAKRVLSVEVRVRTSRSDPIVKFGFPTPLVVRIN